MSTLDSSDLNSGDGLVLNRVERQAGERARIGRTNSISAEANYVLSKAETPTAFCEFYDWGICSIGDPNTSRKKCKSPRQCLTYQNRMGELSS